jgi:histone deacetylase 1/2
MTENIKLLKSKFKLGEEGDLCDYLGIKIMRRSDGIIVLTQPQLIASILQDLSLQAPNAKGRSTPALSSVLLKEDREGAPFDESFHYRSVIDKLNYLEKSTRPELAYAVHQCARFCTEPRRSHAEAVKRIGRYLLATKGQGIILQPQQGTFDCWVDASHAGEWNKSHAQNDPSTAKSRTGYVIMFAGCPLVWASKLQTEIALSSTEAEYIALSTATREIIPLIAFLKEAKERGVPVDVQDAAIHCKIFEDNSGAIEMAKVPKMRPRTKHLNIKYHFFRQHVQTGLLSVYAVKTENQIADIFTKPLNEQVFQTHRKSIIGW